MADYPDNSHSAREQRQDSCQVEKKLEKSLAEKRKQEKKAK